MEASGRSIWNKGGGKPGQDLPRVCSPGQEGGWVEALEWFVPRPVGAGRKARQGMGARPWGGSQNNGIPCIWTLSSEIHIFHGDRARENRQGKGRAGCRVSPAPAEMHSQPSARSPQTPGHRKATGALLSSWPWWNCPVALEAGRDASQCGP